jgi:predicted N-acetyltransferase YhbS
VRAPEPHELHAVYAMGYDAWGEGRSLAAYSAACAASDKYRSGEWRVLEAGGVLLSSLLLHRLPPEPAGAAAGLGSIATPPELRRRGHAARLIAGALAELDARGVAVVYLHSDIAPRYYERFGFRALPARFQRAPTSVCMVRGGRPDSADSYRAPAYF